MAEDEKNKEADNSAAQPESPTLNFDQIRQVTTNL